jgi:hypothetical protein
MAKYNITADGNLLKLKLVVTAENFKERIITFKSASTELVNDRIKFYESGVYKISLGFIDINLVGITAPTNLDNAAALINTLNGTL